MLNFKFYHLVKKKEKKRKEIYAYLNQISCRLPQDGLDQALLSLHIIHSR